MKKATATLALVFAVFTVPAAGAAQLGRALPAVTNVHLGGQQLIPPGTPTPVVWSGFEVNGLGVWDGGSRLDIPAKTCRFFKVSFQLEWAGPAALAAGVSAQVRLNGVGKLKGSPGVDLPGADTPRVDNASGALIPITPSLRRGYVELVVTHHHSEPLAITGPAVGPGTWMQLDCVR